MKKQIEKCFDKCRPEYNIPKCIENLETCVILAKDRDFLDTKKGDTLEKALDNLEGLLGGDPITLESEGTGVELARMFDKTIYVSTLESETVQIEKREDGTVTLEVETSLENTGAGVKLYKSPGQLKTLISDTLTITGEENEVRIEGKFGGDNYYSDLIHVRSTYRGITELGTLSQPFKTIQGAVEFYIGTGTKDAPEQTGRIIYVMRGDDYILSGSITVSNLNIRIQEGVTIRSGGEFFIDTKDLNEYINHVIKVHLGKYSKILLEEGGVRETGKPFGSLNTNKIYLTGEGVIESRHNRGYILESSSYARPIDRSFIEAKDITLRASNGNVVNTTGYGVIRLENVLKEVGSAVFQEGGVDREDAPVMVVMGNGTLKERNCVMDYRPFERSVPYLIRGESTVEIDKCNFEVLGNVETFFVNSGGRPNLKVIFSDIKANELGRLAGEGFNTEIRFNNTTPTTIEEGSIDEGSINSFGDTAYLNVRNYYSQEEARDPRVDGLFNGALFTNEGHTASIGKWFLDVVRYNIQI